MALNAKQQIQLKRRLANASRSAIRQVMPRLTKGWQARSWLSQRNPYRKDSDKQIRLDSSQGQSLQHAALSEYIAASAVTHCFDGWSYLGRALEAEMAADPDTARHLGYYAELRAAMSLLASEGIGVFNKHHVVVEKTGICYALTTFGGTHEFVWNALDIWAGTKAGQDAVLLSIKPGHVPLSEWLNQLNIGSNFLGSGWLREWGIDLSRLAADRNARNHASYRPTAFTTPGPRSISKTMKGVLQLWEVCDPEANGGFPILDRYLLRRSLELVWQGRRTTKARKSYEQHLELALAGITPTGQPVNWRDFLSYQKLNNVHEIIRDANGNDDAFHPDHSKQVLARSTLLLRVATGCSAHLLGEAGTNLQADLDFWRASPSVRRRLWPESDQLASSIDLWSDVEEALDSIEEWLKQHQNGNPKCHHALWTEQASAASILATTERAFLWGVGL